MLKINYRSPDLISTIKLYKSIFQIEKEMSELFNLNNIFSFSKLYGVAKRAMKVQENLPFSCSPK